MTPEVVQFISSCLDEDDREGIEKQRHTARRIYQRPVEECGFSGSESSVRNLVHDMRAARKETKAFVPLRFAPGEAVQIDWDEATVYINGPVLHPAVSQLRPPYVIAYKRQNLESFLDAIIRTFQYYGGVPRRVIFDDARVAVKSGFGAHAAAQDDYRQQSARYGCEPVFCNPASGNEKRLVKNLVCYTQASTVIMAHTLADVFRRLLIDERGEVDVLLVQYYPWYLDSVGACAEKSVNYTKEKHYEGNHSCRRLRHTALPADQGHLQAAAPCL